jgi:predicted CXXCH cytochrome family protein
MAFRPPTPRNSSKAAAMALALLLSLCAGCDATTRHKVLTYFFDGVPPLQESGAGQTGLPPGGTFPVPGRPASFQEHGPYAAKLCGACHNQAMGNALVVPANQLCYQCHDLKLDKPYIHGPLASGGCLVCHDPHSSPYRPLLVSESDSFCFHCHDRDSVERNSAHADLQEQCTACHDAHMSDNKYLLK